MSADSPIPSDKTDDEFDRDSFYSDGHANGASADDDADEYELEPIDEEILEAQRRRAEAEIAIARTEVDVERLHAEANETPEMEDYLSDFRFQFGIKHMMIATAGLAILLALWQAGGAAGLLVLALIVLVSSHVFLGWKEQRRQAVLKEKRESIVQMRRDGKSPAEIQAAMQDNTAEAEELVTEEAPPLRLNFSIKQIFIVLTIAAIVLAALNLVGTAVLASVLGLVSVIGIVVFAFGVEAPPTVMLGWWVMLLLYIGMSVLGILG